MMEDDDTLRDILAQDVNPKRGQWTKLFVIKGLLVLSENVHKVVQKSGILL